MPWQNHMRMKLRNSSDDFMIKERKHELLSSLSLTSQWPDFLFTQ